MTKRPSDRPTKITGPPPTPRPRPVVLIKNLMTRPEASAVIQVNRPEINYICKTWTRYSTRPAEFCKKNVIRLDPVDRPYRRTPLSEMKRPGERRRANAHAHTKTHARIRTYVCASRDARSTTRHSPIYASGVLSTNCNHFAVFLRWRSELDRVTSCVGHSDADGQTRGRGGYQLRRPRAQRRTIRDSNYTAGTSCIDRSDARAAIGELKWMSAGIVDGGRRWPSSPV